MCVCVCIENSCCPSIDNGTRKSLLLFSLPFLYVSIYLFPSLKLLQTAANVAQEQAEADEDASLQQRVLMGAGTTLEGASEMTDNDIASGT